MPNAAWWARRARHGELAVGLPAAAEWRFWFRVLVFEADQRPAAPDAPPREGDARDAGEVAPWPVVEDVVHAEPAAEIGPAEAAALDWLLLSLPEARLPERFDPRGRQLEQLRRTRREGGCVN